MDIPRLKVLHTSDWHLGHRLVEQSRHQEFQNFLDFLLQTVKDEKIDLLLVAGDIFDNIHPDNASQKLYYNFLARLQSETCAQAVIIAGNHDSPSLIDAPKEVLLHNSTYVIGRGGTDKLDDELLTIYSKDDAARPLALVAAVPFLHDGDLKYSPEELETYDREQILQHGIVKHYEQIAELAQKRREELANTYGTEIATSLPLIAMGHLFTLGCEVTDNSEATERELYVGKAVRIDASAMVNNFDYTALGHIHKPQKVEKRDNCQYCGTPIPMSFSESKHQKHCCLVEFIGRTPHVRYINIPVWQQLATIQGTAEELLAQLNDFIATDTDVWVKAICTDTESQQDLYGKLQRCVKDSSVHLLSLHCPTVPECLILQEFQGRSIDEITPVDMFDKLMDEHKISDNSERKQLLELFHIALAEVNNDEERQASGEINKEI